MFFLVRMLARLMHYANLVPPTFVTKCQFNLHTTSEKIYEKDLTIYYKRMKEGTMPEAWKERHRQAMCEPRGMEIPIVGMLAALCQYARESEKIGYRIGEDPVLGHSWLELAHGLSGLLDGETGRLDCGSVSHSICEAIWAAGFSAEELLAAGFDADLSKPRE